MRGSSTNLRRLWGARGVAAAALVWVAGLAWAQQGNVQQELQIFSKHVARPATAILQQLGTGGTGGAGAGGGLGALLGGSLGGGLGGSGGSLTGSQASLIQQQQLLQQRQLQGQAQLQPAIPIFKPGDAVLVDLSLPEQPQPASVQPEAAPNAAQANNAQAGVGGLPLSTAQLAQLTGQNSTTTQSTQEAPQPTMEQLQATERQKLQDLTDLIRVHNPYQLDGNGELLLPGIPPIALQGLTEALATQRVAAEPAFARLQVRLTRLPLEKTGPEALKPFGYELFDNSTLGMLATLNMPVPADYVVGPGDILQVQLYGSQTRTYSLTVGRDGFIHLPELGPIDVGGRRYSDVKSEIENQVAGQMVGVRANVSIGETRTINVFVLGGAKYPGSYTLTGLATVTTALFAAGGVEKTGSLRNIQVKRQGQTVRTLDLYDLLMRGDSSGDIKLLPGDVVFIPPVGPTVSLNGEVIRPAIYELKGSQTVDDLIGMGGGMTPNADRDHASLVRIDEQQQRIVVNVDPSAASVVRTPLRNGDVLQIERLLPELDLGVTLQGYVYQPRSFAWHPGLRLSQIIPTIYELKPDADLHYLLVRREVPPDRHIEVLSADLAGAMAAPGSQADLLLMPRDAINRIRSRNKPRVRHPTADERIARAIEPGATDPDRAYRRTCEGTGRLPVGAGHAYQRPDPCRRRVIAIGRTADVPNCRAIPSSMVTSAVPKFCPSISMRCARGKGKQTSRCKLSIVCRSRKFPDGRSSPRSRSSARCASLVFMRSSVVKRCARSWRVPVG